MKALLFSKNMLLLGILCNHSFENTAHLMKIKVTYAVAKWLGLLRY